MAKKKRTSTRKKTTSAGLWRDIRSALKRSFTRETGIPTTKAGVKRKLGTMIVDALWGVFTKKKETK
ncbi:MAG: hypothetical protein IJ456_07010 [Bacteroides sp.]|nr:hypothetical protein [Bacteroides sp.]